MAQPTVAAATPELSPTGLTKSSAIKFVVLLGVVSLFADMTYEGARSVTGPYLAVLGATGTVVGIVAGFGELVGYGLRLVSGYWADRTRRYWTIAIFGYLLNMLAVPALALAGRWEVAAVFMVLERTGKALRNPPRDVMLSHATHETGRGWGFGLHEAMDQTGAMVGPLIVAAVLASRGEYRTGFAFLLVPAILALATLFTARFLYPRPQDLEPIAPELASTGLPRAYWLYLAGAALVAAGFADFPLVAYHFEKASTVSPTWIPIFYAVAMGVSGLGSLLFGRWFDRAGLIVLVPLTAVSALFAPLVFLGGFNLALLGVALWGIGMGVHESVMRAAVAGMVPSDRRGSAYGIFNTGYGLAWFLGSALMGVLYDYSLPALIAVSVVLSFVGIPLFLVARQATSAPEA